MSSAPSSPSVPVDSNFIDEEAEERLDVNAVLQSLAHRRRREILALLDDEPEWTRVELITALYDVQAGQPVSPRTELETALVHQHLPQLEEAELISLENDSWNIHRGEDFQLVREMAEAATSVSLE